MCVLGGGVGIAINAMAVANAFQSKCEHEFVYRLLSQVDILNFFEPNLQGELKKTEKPNSANTCLDFVFWGLHVSLASKPFLFLKVMHFSPTT